MVYCNSLPRSVVLCILASCAAAAIYDQFSHLPSGSYDFVIVGAGAAGSVVANRLTENPKFSVLLLEAGGRTQDVFDAQVPWLATRLANTALDWNFTTVPQPGLKGRTLAYPRGFGLGGSTAINGMFYTRGSKDDFDRYASLTGDEEWSWESVQRYFRKNEKWTEPADLHDTHGQFDPRVHSQTGINDVSLSAFQQPLNKKVIQTTRESDLFPFNLDMNSGSPLGLGWLQTTINSHGRRSSAATSYLAPKYVERPNLHILLHAKVTRVLTDGVSKNPLQIRGVEFFDRSATRRVVNATKEIVLSAGTIMTPHILLHSGIGSSSELSAVGILPIHDLPSVGKNLTEQPLFPGPTVILGTPPDSNQTLTCTPMITQSLLEEWKQKGQGPLAASPVSHIAWMRLGETEAVKRQFGIDPAAGANTPHVELAVSSICELPPTGNFMGFGLSVVSPASRGSITVNNTDPLLPPVIDVNLYGHPFDLAAMRKAFRFAQQFVSAPAWTGYVIQSTFDLNDDDALDEAIKAASFGGAHPVGTASMSKDGSSSGVVNSDLRVKGMLGLRVVDASVLPRVPSAHTQAPTYVVGEKGSNLIKAAWIE